MITQLSKWNQINIVKRRNNSFPGGGGNGIIRFFPVSSYANRVF